ncbi:hypothetical protein C2S53_018116 [Perilla frutescens var. hirtella]|uniref:Uncharacterized protein n=1 Tax=Perilla frutescens var. hirtella TaxID=608512 RepID=A0AAD4NZ25_PERFH|nr:hypothetical protein C2S53_018116 [Perilla frutescens var. hirtella]
MIGFDEVLLQQLYLLTGEPSGRRIIPVEGMGGIDTDNESRIIVGTWQSDVVDHLSLLHLAMNFLDNE